MRIDSSEVGELVTDFITAPSRIEGELEDVWRNEAMALHGDMRRDAENHRYLPSRTRSGGKGFAPSLGREKRGELDYVVGFHKSGQGNLANIIVFGSINNAPVYNFYGPLTRRTPFFVEHLARVCEAGVFRGTGT